MLTVFPTLVALARLGVALGDPLLIPVSLGVTIVKLVTVNPPKSPLPPGVGVPVATRMEVGMEMLVAKVAIVVFK